jgi:hypothetical protein
MKFKVIVSGMLLCLFFVSCDSDISPFSGWSPYEKGPASGNVITVTLNFKGTVTDMGDGSPIKGVNIKLYSELSTCHKSRSTNKNGQYSMRYHGRVSDLYVGLLASKRRCSPDLKIVTNFTAEEQVFNFELYQYDK